MEKKYLDNFTVRFRYLNHAGLLISGHFYKSDLKQRTIDEIESVINQNDIWSPDIFRDIFNEIEKNLFDDFRNREIYLRQILKKFVQIAPFLNIAADKEFCLVQGRPGFKMGNQEYSHDHLVVYETLMNRHAWEMQYFDDIPITIPERYVIQCFKVYRRFFNQLDSLCNDFDINLMEFQKANNFKVWEREELTSWSLLYDTIALGQKSDLQAEQSSTEMLNSKKDVSSFRNNFDHIKADEVYKHFKAGLVDKNYISEADLIDFLKAAFENQQVPERLFKIKAFPTKTKIIEVFYRYYKNIAGKPYGKQKKYAALLGDYFEGFDTKNVSSNFSKADY